MRGRVFVAVAVVASVVTLAAQKQTLTDQDKADAVRIGVKEKGKLTGLLLQESSRGWANANAISAMNTGVNGYRSQSVTGTSRNASTVRIRTACGCLPACAPLS